METSRLSLASLDAGTARTAGEATALTYRGRRLTVTSVYNPAWVTNLVIR